MTVRLGGRRFFLEKNKRKNRKSPLNRTVKDLPWCYDSKRQCHWRRRVTCRKEDIMEKIKAVLPKKEDVVKNVVAGGVVITLMALMFTGGVGTVISLAAFGGIVITSNLM